MQMYTSGRQLCKSHFGEMVKEYGDKRASIAISQFANTLRNEWKNNGLESMNKLLKEAERDDK